MGNSEGQGGASAKGRKQASGVASSSSSSKRPSPEEIEAKRRERAEKKVREERERQEAQRQRQLQLEADGGAGAAVLSPDGRQLFEPRRWSAVAGAQGEGVEHKQRIKVLSWNILAQGLVRRKLFPGSDCLRWKDREEGLSAEMLSLPWDVGCFQEVDRIEDHGPKLKESGRAYLYAKGYARKQHGLMVAWNTSSWRTTRFKEHPAGSKLVYLDDETIDEEGKRTGLSRVTRNIGLFAALALDDQGSDEQRGIIVATTHLFWHPMHAYERVRQSGLLKRALLQWRQSNEAWRNWPVVLAGDFNDQPHSATYALMTASDISAHCRDEVQRSTVVHTSVDERRANLAVKDLGKLDIAGEAAAPKEGGEAGEEEKEEEGDCEEEEEGEGEDENAEGSDQMLKNCRAAKEQDGLLSFDELVELHSASRASSAYGQHFGSLQEDQAGNYFGSKERGKERYDDTEWKEGQANIHLGPSKEYVVLCMRCPKPCSC